VNVISPVKRSSRLRIRSSRVRQRSDLLATRIGFDPARASIASEFDHIASRSTKAKGASTCSKICSSSAWERTDTTTRLVAATRERRGRDEDRNGAHLAAHQRLARETGAPGS
jgi:hypothetical protein